MRRLIPIALVILLTSLIYVTSASAQQPDTDRAGACLTASEVTQVFSLATAVAGSVDAAKAENIRQSVDIGRKRFAKTDLEAPLKDVAVLAGYLEQAAASEVVPDISRAVAQADRRVDRFLISECSFKQVKVVGRENSFSGAPDHLRTGLYAFRFRNSGQEPHEMAVLRIPGDMPLDQFLASPASLDPSAIVAAVRAVPGASDTAYLILTEAGRYALVDALPVGTTSLSDSQTGGAETHAARGMVSEFKVTKRGK